MRFAPISYAALAVSLLATTPAIAQGVDANGEIIVTARKRDETSLSVPVVVTAVSNVELERRAVNNLDGLSRLVPQLMVGPQGGSVQGGNISIRGIAGPDNNPFGDQAVSFNIDGVAIGKSSIRRMTDVDIEQVEVLKGPQALFYGKNSPGGIVTIRTADPTPNFSAKISTGYEFKAHEWRTEGYVSAPLGDTLGIRVAGTYSDMDGYVRNDIPANANMASTSSNRMPNATKWAGRVTLKWDPSDRFDARFKFNYAKSKDRTGPAALTQYTSCPFGVPQSGALGDCKADGHGMTPGNGEVMAAVDPVQFRDGRNYQDQKQILTSLELNYQLNDNLKLTSVTGYYDIKLNQASNYENDYAIALPSNNWYSDKEFSQELRISSDYDGPLNFSGGLYYSQTSAVTGSTTYLFPSEESGSEVLALNGLGFIPLNTPLQINNYEVKQKGKAYSAYLQLIYKPVKEIEIDVGGRYSNERKRVPYVLDEAFDGAFNPFGYNPLTSADLVTTINPKKGKWNDFSPEVTVSYRPTDKITTFASYKHGFLSGGFNSSSVAFRAEPDIHYNQQTIKGFEAGIKALVLDNKLRLNLAAYTYKMKGLQLSNFTNATSTIRNAGSAKVEGVEFDFNYKTPLEGLTINGAAAYNKGKYTENLTAPCYNGQSIAEGCDGSFVEAAGPVPAHYTTQDLSGTELPRAPKWNLSGGFSYDTLISDSFKLGLSGDVIHSSSYLTDSTSDPAGRQKSYTLLDATLRVADANDTWEVAFIGRNLTNKYYYFASANVPFTGNLAGLASGGIHGDRFASVARGRELMVRLSYKFGK